MKSNIVWSVEKWYSHQLKDDKIFYDNLAHTYHSPYKYINTGTFIGYKKDLFELITDIQFSITNETFLKELASEGWDLTSKFVDQTIISHHLVKFWNKYNIKLDVMCEIFYVPSQDWYNITNHINQKFVVSDTMKTTSIIHVPYKLKYEYILKKLYYAKYASDDIFKNMKYSWHRGFIMFLENGEMKAFGSGKYQKINKYIFIANFGNYDHIIKFNNDYTEFTSLRKHDNEEIKGKLLWC